MGDELLVVRDAEGPSRPLDREEHTLVLGCVLTQESKSGEFITGILNVNNEMRYHKIADKRCLSSSMGG